MKIISWNVNSVNTRLEHLLHMLQNVQPDFVCLQEIKCENARFPIEQITDAGYCVAVSGMKSYNGVAIISKHKLEDVSFEFPHGEIDVHNELYKQEPRKHLESRYIEALACVGNSAVRIASVYVPNGGVSAKEADLDLGIYDTERFKYKEAFYRDFKAHCQNLISQGENLAFAGDYNIAPQAIDVYNPKGCSKNIGFLPREQEIIADFQTLMPDYFRKLNPSENGFSWWDYRRGGYPENRGMRIDQILFSPNLEDKIQAISVLKNYREMERPSDHAPVLGEFAL
jgi:exodeoxyribonuclease-3